MENVQKSTTNYKDLIGSNIRKAIHDKGYTQVGFAKKVGKTTSQINRYCLGKTMPSPDIFKEIADALDLDIEQLFYYNHVAEDIEENKYKKRLKDVISELEASILYVEDLSMPVLLDTMAILGYTLNHLGLGEIDVEASGKLFISIVNHHFNRDDFIKDIDVDKIFNDMNNFDLYFVTDIDMKSSEAYFESLSH